MPRLIMLTSVCGALASAAFGQGASGNAVAAVGYLYPAPVVVAPGQLVTVFVVGNLQGNISAKVQQTANHAAPVLEVRASMTGITSQIPYEIERPCLACAAPVGAVATQLLVTANGAAGAQFELSPLTDRVHILTACDTVLPRGSGYAPSNGLPCSPLMSHADGSLVNSVSPAQGGEEVVAYAVGLGPTTPAVATGRAAATSNSYFRVRINLRRAGYRQGLCIQDW
ncbi:MAG TPA: hypothetical protein VN924_26225 [Bryobacteraceae bacterium]|nr:hypothetical protein [Bryobacteraceae bacterium]